QLREDRAQTGAIHLLVDLLREVLFRRVGEHATTPTPQRGRGHAGAGAARALLAPRLLGGMLDRAAILLGAVAATGIGLVGHDDLVYQRFVELATEDGIGRCDGGSGLSL